MHGVQSIGLVVAGWVFRPRKPKQHTPVLVSYPYPGIYLGSVGRVLEETQENDLTGTCRQERGSIQTVVPMHRVIKS